MPKKQSKTKSKKRTTKNVKRRPLKTNVLKRKKTNTVKRKKTTNPKRIRNKPKQKISNSNFNLIGPMELDILDRKSDGARIVLLGDIHVRRAKCKEDKGGIIIYEYLQKLFENYTSTKYLDFFLETDYVFEQDEDIVQFFKRKPKGFQASILDKSMGFPNYLEPIRSWFKGCLQPTKTLCEFYGKPIRFHYADTRTFVAHSGTDNETLELVKEFHNTRGTFIEKEGLQSILKLLSKYQEKNVDFFFKITKIDKQLHKIRDRRFRELMKQHMLNIMQRDEPISIRAKEITINVLEKMKHNEVMSLGEISAPSNYVGALMQPLMDIYILSRIVRHNMKRVIIYAGAAHTRDLKKFLIEFMQFQTTVHRKSGREFEDVSKQDSFQCIDLKDVPEPWFTV